jgi:hypothetical protein
VGELWTVKVRKNGAAPTLSFDEQVKLFTLYRIEITRNTGNKRFPYRAIVKNNISHVQQITNERGYYLLTQKQFENLTSKDEIIIKKSTDV